MLEKYIHCTEYYSEKTLSELEELIGKVQMKDRHSIPSIIDKYFEKILLGKYTDKDEYRKHFLDWFNEVDASCGQLGYGYRFKYDDGKGSDHHHWGVPKGSYKEHMKQTEELTMIARLMGYKVKLYTIPEREIWGN